MEIQKSKVFKGIWVSTDHEDIANEAEKCKKISLPKIFFLIFDRARQRQRVLA
jgi:CMP-N-acetylneuraminic acid synthetase